MPSRGTWIVVTAVLAGSVLFASRHSLPDILAILDQGPPAIPATSYAERLATERSAKAKRDGDRPEAAARVGFDGPADDAQGKPVIIGSWTFAAPDLAISDEPEQAWRTSFGSERKVDPRTDLTAGFSADLIVVTGIRDYQALRQVFSQRDFFTVASPQLANLAMIQGGSGKPFQSPAVAIVVRRMSGLRSGRRIQLEFAMSEAESILSSGPRDLFAAGPAMVSLPFAVQISVGRSRFWVVAFDRSEACADKAQCLAIESITRNLSEWLGARKRDGDTLIVVEHALKPSPPLPAPDLSIGNHGGVSRRDAGCRPANLAFHAWSGETGSALIASAETIWRTRPSGGDCVLLTRLLVPVPAGVDGNPADAVAGRMSSEPISSADQPDESPGRPSDNR